MMLSAPRRSQLDGRRLAMKRVLSAREVTGSRSAKFEPPQTPSASEKRPPSQSKPAAAAVDELPKQVELRRGEVAGFD